MTKAKMPEVQKAKSRRLFFLLSTFCFLLFFTSCTSPKSNSNPVAQPELALSVEARPQAVPADGSSHLVIFVEFRRGTDAIPDSTEIILLNTMGTLGRGILYTHSGVALDTLTSDTTTGNGWIIAYANGVRDSVEVSFTTP